MFNNKDLRKLEKDLKKLEERTFGDYSPYSKYGTGLEGKIERNHDTLSDLYYRIETLIHETEKLKALLNEVIDYVYSKENK